MNSQLYDSYQRRINYLRLSVTDRCNFRCQYCMPDNGIEKQQHKDILSYEDLMLISRAAVSLGVEKIRITGGEPLVRAGIIDFLARLKALPGLDYLALTTNGYLLEKHADSLKEIGVTSLNVSLDSLDASRFAAITRTGNLALVLKGLQRAHQLEIPIKVNVVVMKGVNDHEILDFAALAWRYDISVRFIEFMPSSVCSSLQGISSADIQACIAGRYHLEEVGSDNHSGPAQNYRIVGGRGRIGVISAMSCPFCSSCNRIRVTSGGKMKNCLFSDDETDLKPFLTGGDIDALSHAMIANVLKKPEKHHVHWGESGRNSLLMARVGG